MSQMPSLGRLARAGREREDRPVRRSEVLGETAAGVRRSRGEALDPGIGAGRPRREQDRTDLHRRSQRRLPLLIPSQDRRGEPAGVDLTRRRFGAIRRLRRSGCSMRSPGQCSDADRKRQLHALPGSRDRRSDAATRDGRAGRVRLGCSAARDRGQPRKGQAETAVRSRDRRGCRTVQAVRVLPPEPAEHVHREADRTYD